MMGCHVWKGERMTVKAKALRFRWINGQCLQIQLPNGKCIVTDPFFPSPKSDCSAFPQGDPSRMTEPFDESDFGRIDYMILNHSHGDHIYRLQQIFDMYRPVIIVQGEMAVEMAKVYRIPMTSIYPVNFCGTYHFDGFTLHTYHGTHHPVGIFAEQVESMPRDMVDNPDAFEWNVLGGLFNMNFTLTTPEGCSLAFFGGNIDADLEEFAKLRPTVLFRNKLHSSKTKYDEALVWAEYLRDTRIPLMVPMHHEKWYVTRPGFVEQLVEDMNSHLKEWGSISRVLDPKRTKWYSLNFEIEEE